MDKDTKKLPVKETPEEAKKASKKSGQYIPSTFMRVFIGMAVVVLIVAVGFAIYKRINPTESTKTASAGADAKVATVKITKSGFEPASLTIQTGTIVEWVSDDDSATHVVAANPYPTHKDQPDLVSQQLAKGAKFRFTFSKAGTYNYHDDLKPTTNGVIVVK